jgi:hypothetical protein
MKSLKVIAAIAILAISSSANAWWDNDDGYGRGRHDG